MDEPRKAASGPIVAALVVAAALLLAPLGVYVGGYLTAGKFVEINEWRGRSFTHQWQIKFYCPAAKVESIIRWREVELGTSSGCDDPPAPENP